MGDTEDGDGAGEEGTWAHPRDSEVWTCYSGKGVEEGTRRPCRLDVEGTPSNQEPGVGVEQGGLGQSGQGVRSRDGDVRVHFVEP